MQLSWHELYLCEGADQFSATQEIPKSPTAPDQVYYKTNALVCPPFESEGEDTQINQKHFNDTDHGVQLIEWMSLTAGRINVHPSESDLIIS